MYCSECGNENNDRAKFCSRCGQGLTITTNLDEQPSSIKSAEGTGIANEKIKKQISVTGRSIYFVGMLSLLSGLILLFIKFSGGNLSDYGLVDNYLNIFNVLLLGGILSYYGNTIWNHYDSGTKRNLQIVLWVSMITLGGMSFSLILYGTISIGWIVAVLIIVYTSFALRSLGKVSDYKGLSLEDSKGKTGIFLLVCLFAFSVASLIIYDYSDYNPLNRVSSSDYEVTETNTFYTITDSNVRSCASISCNKIGYYPPQAELYFDYKSLAEMPDWVEVPVDTGEIGYLSKTTLSEQVVGNDFPYEDSSLQYNWYDRHNVPMAYRCYTTMTNPCSEAEWITALSYSY